MDRAFAYSGAIPLDTDLLSTNKDSYIGLAKLSAAILGLSNTFVNSATCTPSSPASLNVIVSACEIYAVEQIDPNAYGDLGTDTHNILKQGVNLNTTTVAITAPGTGGYSQNYLIQFGFNEVDGGSTVLTYYNASNPAAPWSGPNNTGAANNTVRQDQVSIQAKAGIAAPTGTQTTPTPDTGYIGGFVVTVANGQTQITSGNITAYLANNPNFINETLTQKISQTTADARYAQQTQVQTGQFIYAGTDSGTANTYVGTLTPVPGSYTAGMEIRLQISNTNTGASTLNLNAIGATAIKRQDLTALQAGDLLANEMAYFIYDGTYFQLLNPLKMIRSITRQVFTTNSTYTPHPGLLWGDVEVLGGGGGGAGATSGSNQSGTGSGGGAGGYAKKLLTASAIGASKAVTIGAAGSGGAAGSNGNAGGTSSFGSLISCTGGIGGSPLNSDSTPGGLSGGAGGTATGGDVNVSGNSGSGALGLGTSQAAISGAGGASPYGSGGANNGCSGGGTGPGGAGGGYGSGGGGSCTGGAQNSGGASGAPGIIIVTEYNSI